MNNPAISRFFTLDWICIEAMFAVIFFAPSWIIVASPVCLIAQVAVYPDRYRTRKGSLVPAFALVGFFTLFALITWVVGIIRGEKLF